MDCQTASNVSWKLTARQKRRSVENPKQCNVEAKITTIADINAHER